MRQSEAEMCDLYDSAYIKDRLPFLGEVLIYDTVGSTNTEAKARLSQGDPGETLIMAEEQSAGRGRLGRTWHSTRSESLIMSYIVRPDMALADISMITIAAALAAAEAVRELTGLEAMIKWPNDIFVRGHKICGILTEAVPDPDGGPAGVVVGMGINVHNRHFPEGTGNDPSSLDLLGGRGVSRQELAAEVIRRLRDRISVLERDGDLRRMIDEYESLMTHMNREIALSSYNNPELTGSGVCRGIDRRGRLIADWQDGTERHLDSGEITVRK